MTELLFRQTGEFHVIERAKGTIETAFEFSEIEVDGRAKVTGVKKYTLRRGAVELKPNDDGSLSTHDGARTFDRA